MDPEFRKQRSKKRQEIRERLKNILSEDERTKLKEGEKKRIAAYRKRKKDSLVEKTDIDLFNINNAYKSKQAYGKAIKKAEHGSLNQSQQVSNFVIILELNIFL